MKTKIINLILLFSGLCLGHSQGFVNLNFEQGYSTSNTIPGWTAYLSGTSKEVVSNDIALNGGAVCLLGTNGGFQPIQGKYFAYLQGQILGFPDSVPIGQIGTIPITALSMIFWGNVGANDVSFAGQNLSLIVLGSSANYKIYGANISEFAGVTGQLLFTSYSSQLGGQWDSVDNIQFSSSPVPEPSILGLSTLVGLFFAWRGWKK